MIKNKFLRAVLPGIRAKLSFFTAVLVISILFITSVIHYRQQSAALEEKLVLELRSPLEYVNSVVIDLENLSRSLVLVEEYKIRVKEKKKELSKFKRTVVSKEKGFLGALKSFGQSIGLNVKRGNVYHSVDTYFSRYLSEKEITDFEINVKNRLRKENGAPIDPPVYERIRVIAERVASARIGIETSKSRIEEAEEEKKFIEEELKQEGLAPKDQKKLTINKDKLEKDKKAAEKNIIVSEKKIESGETALAKALQSFFRGSYKDKISSLGLVPDKIRILAYDRNGKETLDTGLLFSISAETGKKLFQNTEFKENKSSLFHDKDVITTIQSKSEPENYEVGGRQYEVVYRPVFRSPITAERSRMIAEDLVREDSVWVSFLEEDKKISLEIGELSQKLKFRLSVLRKEGKIKPSSDAEYKSLTTVYRQLIKKRESKLESFQPYKQIYFELEQKWKNKRESVIKKISEKSNEIIDWQKRLKTPPKEGEKQFSPEEIQDKIRSLEATEEELRDSLIQLEATKEDWSSIQEKKLEDSFFGLREAALEDFTFLSFQTGSSGLRKYYKEVGERKETHVKWKLLRDWILSGDSETELSKYTKSKWDSGILVRSRSEAEEMMWALDSTPLSIEGGKTGKGLVYDLLRKDLLGYNIVLIDRTEGARQMRKNREELLQFTAIIGGIAILLAYILAWFVVRRIRLISQKAEEIGEGKLDVQFPKAGYDEIGILSESLNDMVRGLKEGEEMRGELLAAEEIQKRLLPETLPTHLKDQVEFGAFYKAMAGVGGDYYDFIELENGKVAFCVGDVSNHGVGPAIIMALFRAQIRSILRRGERNLKKILLEVNAHVYDDTPDHIFVTFFMGIFDSTNSRIEYISAGHVKPLFYDASEKKLHFLPAGGLPVGMDENSFFETTIERRALNLESGDLFFQYTDGLDEARSPDGSMFTKERVAKLIKENGEKSPEELIEIVVSELQVHTTYDLKKSGLSKLNDDVAMIALRKK